MSYFPHGAFVAIHAAEKRRQQEEEEEAMTKYSLDELEDNFEFKIVRSEIGSFRKPENLRRLVQEESIAGWELLEKLDDRRVRFKRPLDARRRDINLPPGYDPYRTAFDRSNARVLMVIMVGLVMLVGVVTSVLFGAGSAEMPILFTVLGLGIAVVVILFMVIVIARRNR